MRRNIKVRSLIGDSVRVMIEPNKVVQDLKLLLKQCFAPASSSSNFIFSSRVKLRLKSQISSYSIRDEDFLVLPPFLKKDMLEGADAGLSENPNAGESFETESADSALVEMMEDLSSLRDAPNFETLSRLCEMDRVMCR